MYGCRYLRFDPMRQIEYCTITGQATNGAPMCDVDYGLCPEYREALKPLNEVNERSQQSERESCTKQSSHTEYVQTSIFGTVGEVPFK